MMTPPSTSSSPSAQHVQRLYSCRWAWCRQVFSVYLDLEHHVINDHVLTAIPVRRRDLAILRRAEEGIGESLSMGLFNRSVEDTREEPAESLSPSPPATAPYSLRQSSRAPVSLDQSGSGQQTPSQKRPAAHQHLRTTVGSASQYKLASLDSPTHSLSHNMPVGMVFPLVEDLVDRTIHDLRRGVAHLSQESPASMHKSQSSSGSSNSVEKQLTQETPVMEVDEDSLDYHFSYGPLQTQAPYQSQSMSP